MQLVFAANMVSMLGSGMNSAAVTWYILQTTGSEMALGTLVVLQTVPAMLTLPFTGVIIDREDRRYLVMLLDAARALVILAMALLAFYGKPQLWQVYVMAMLVATGFWMFWPTVTALIQELTPDAEFVAANTFLLAGVQGGWLMAGAIVGFVYNHIGLGGVLLIDFVTYVVSFLCYLGVRKGRQVVTRPERQPAPGIAEGSWARYLHDLREGLRYVKARPYVTLLGVSWALFIGAMLSQGVVTAPLSERILHAGAVGFGWLNGGWGVGAFVSAWYAPAVIAWLRPRRAVGFSMAALAASLVLVPYLPVLAAAVALYALMGSARGVGGVAISSSMMEIVPPHFMGRVQNTFYFLGTVLQIMLGFMVGLVARDVGLRWAFATIGLVYFAAFLTAVWPVSMPREEQAVADSAEA